MAIVLSGSTNDITVNGVSVATDTEVSSAITDAVQTGLVALQTIATGTATFTATTNNINLTGIGIGVEIGDVIQISGADDAKNNSEFTVEVITDANNIIVNQAHANKGTSKNVAARASDTGVNVKLLAKWYNAPLGLGQDWVSVISSRAAETTYPNNTKRSIEISVTFESIDGARFQLYINGEDVARQGNATIGGNTEYANIAPIIKSGNTYTVYGINGTVILWKELR